MLSVDQWLQRTKKMPITHRIPGLVLIDHEFSVPLDYEKPDGETISVFAREVVAPAKEKEDLPWLVFLQGGPGFGAPRPEDRSGWLKRALQDYRVLLLDQRGTGRSTPVLPQTLAHFLSPQEQVDYLTQFRADSIIRDAEWIRKKLLEEGQPWSVLGQSYGGFCAVTYLSQAPEGLREVFITGGLPPLTVPVDDVYRATYVRIIQKNREYYQRYPEDVEQVRKIVEYLDAHEVWLPNGDRLTSRRFRQLGFAFGMSNGFAQVHYLLENAFVDGVNGKEISYYFLRGFENSLAFDTNPIYAILHEAIYCQGAASNWSAQRILAEFPEFEISSEHPVYFMGEMIYPWMFEEIGALHPLQEAAEILAAHNDWPPLYDPTILAQNQVPVAAAVYYNDMYVERKLSEQAAALIKGARLWVTNEHEHSALRLHGEEVFGRLHGMLHGEI
jgi:pimeloyl-ACP methyl ester carboxylesterase